MFLTCLPSKLPNQSLESTTGQEAIFLLVEALSGLTLYALE